MSPSGQPSEHTPQHLEEMKAAFALFDRDGSGSIDAVELKALLKAMDQHPSPLELEELLQQMDTDGNGVIDFNEFAAVMGDQFEVLITSNISLPYAMFQCVSNMDEFRKINGNKKEK